MLRRFIARLVWLIVVAAVVNGLAGLCLAALRLGGVINGSWALVLSPLWVPLAIASVLELVLLQLIWASTSTSPLGSQSPASGAGR